jgi:hypothetical protein
MATQQTQSGLAQELNHAIDDLQASLQHAADATAQLRSLLPRVTAIATLFEELQTVIQAGRDQLGGPDTAPAATSFSRPTLVARENGAAQTAQDWAPAPAATADWSQSPAREDEGERAAAVGSNEDLVCFRLEFESRSGPLDLRAVDEAVGEHPAVRDVALLDYDGRKATLKVWIVAGASPFEVQQSLTESASTTFPDANDISIVALEDAA